MAKTVWFVEQNRTNLESVPQRIFYLAQQMGFDVIVKKYIPFSTEHDFSFLPTDRPVVFYGSINMVKSFLKSPQANVVKPFCWFDFEEMSCRSYYTHWGKYIFQSDYAFYTFGEIIRLREKLYQEYAIDGCIFIRPNSNDKVFTGEIVPYDYFNSWVGFRKDWGVGLLQLCVVATPGKIDSEYRLVIADKEVIASSRYRLNGCLDKEEGCPDFVREFANEVVSSVDWQPAPIYCMDIAVTNQKASLMEVGEVNCAGLYEMELSPVVEAMARIAEREFNADRCCNGSKSL